MALDASLTISVRLCVPTDRPRAAERLTSPGRRAIARRVILERSFHVCAALVVGSRRRRSASHTQTSLPLHWTIVLCVRGYTSVNGA